ncbi:MAG: D-glycero-beta-D-manno-heptose 1-phosphate adenylyltransferase [Bacteroidota bacterium]
MNQNNLDVILKKIKSYNDIESELARWRFLSRKIVFTNGCFDVLHRGHVEYLAKAAELGDVLCIGLNSDSSVKKLKGLARPLNDQLSRAIVLAALSFVTCVISFDEETPINLINIVQPDVLVKGGDYVPEKIVGYDVVKKKGGKVITIPLVKGFSTTSIINKLQDE